MADLHLAEAIEQSSGQSSLPGTARVQTAARMWCPSIHRVFDQALISPVEKKMQLLKKKRNNPTNCFGGKSSISVETFIKSAFALNLFTVQRKISQSECHSLLQVLHRWKLLLWAAVPSPGPVVKLQGAGWQRGPQWAMSIHRRYLGHHCLSEALARKRFTG